MHAGADCILICGHFFSLCAEYIKMELFCIQYRKVGISSRCIPLTRRLVLKCFKYHILAQEFNYRFQCPPPLSPAPHRPPPPQVSPDLYCFHCSVLSADFIFRHEMEGVETNTFSGTVDKINLRKLTGDRKNPPFSYDSKPGNLFLVSVGRDR
jgi:hypothetical protein